MKDIELLAPAGDLEKLKTAIDYGADAVFLGGDSFGLRTASKNFSMDKMREGIKYAHDRGRKVHVTLNIIPHNEDFEGLEEYLLELYDAGVDAVLVADPGIFAVVKRVIPNMEIHLSTQASATNYETIMFWYNMGVKRVVLARELSLKEIKEITSKIPEDLEIEAFVHGAMCISHSGRCLLSNYMTGRDANRGDCAHACRFKYNLVEEKRPGEFFPVYEDENGTFIMNSKDLCMIEYIKELAEAGIDSFKIEGRVKSAYYVATVVRSYRMAIDKYYQDGDKYQYEQKWLDEIKKASYRDFTSGFYFDKPEGDAQLYGSTSYIREYDFAGLVLDYDKETKIATIEQRNRIFLGDEIEVFGPNKDFFVQKIEKMTDDKGRDIEVAPHAQQIIKIEMKEDVVARSMIRKPRKDD